jgi:predicted Zn-dependent protease
VIGHEIGHVTARHSAKRMSVGVLTAPVAIASAVAGFGAGLVSPLLRDVVQGTGSLVTGGMVIAPYSRSQETEADEIGQGLAARAGYDPAGIASFMRTLKREGELRTEKARRFHIMDTHPMPADRATKTEERARTLTRSPAAPVAKDPAELFEKLEGLLVGADPAHGVFRESLFLHPELELAIEFPKGWETANTPQAVGAVNPEQDVVVALRMAAADTTLDAVLEKLRQEQKGLEFEKSTIRGLPAARARHSSRGQSADITLIGYRGHVFSVVGQSAERVASAFAPIFSSTAESFRALRGEERRAIRESRLRLRATRAGETPAAVVARTGSTWSAEELALANSVEVDTRFPAGRRVKVAVPEPYSR